MLKSFDQLGSTLEVAVLGTVLLAQLGETPTAESALHAATVTAGAAVALSAGAFRPGLLLPRRARSR